MTLLQLRQAGFVVGGERRNNGGGTVLVRCGCLRWCWAYKSRLAFKARHGHAYRCRQCGEKAQTNHTTEADPCPTPSPTTTPTPTPTESRSA